jgi:putative transposase
VDDSLSPSGRNAAFTCRHFGISRQTFYRWWRRYEPHNLATLEDRSHRPHRLRQPTWTAAQAQAVLALRHEYPRWGKDKLVVLLRRRNLCLSTSRVGRILADLKRRGVLVASRSQAVPTRRRNVRGRPWAIRKPRFWPVRQPGDLVQLDTKEVRPARGVVLEHFEARDMVSRWDVAEVLFADGVFVRAVSRRSARLRPSPPHTLESFHSSRGVAQW